MNGAMSKVSLLRLYSVAARHQRKMHDYASASRSVPIIFTSKLSPLFVYTVWLQRFEAHGCAKLAWSCYLIATRPGIELMAVWSRVRATKYSWFGATPR